jgi:short-subunit dehydrogenase
MPLEGNRVIVTGGSGGIGLPLVRQLVDRQARVHVIGRTATLGSAVTTISADLGTDGGIRAAASAVADIDPDILIHLAGAQHFGPFDEQTDLAILEGYRINLLTPAVLTRAALAGMQRRGSGHVMFAGSVFGAIPFAHFAAYSSAKAGLAALCTALKREYAGRGITFTLAVPRAVRTTMATPAIQKFGEIAGFKFDSPESVANRLLQVLLDGSGDIRPGFPESVFMRLSALSPGLVSRGLAATDRKARGLFTGVTTITKE